MTSWDVMGDARSAPEEARRVQSAYQRVLYLRLATAWILAVAIALIPLFGPHRLAVALVVAIAGSAINLRALSKVRRGGGPGRLLVVADVALVLAVVAVAPRSMPVAAMVIVAAAALWVFWFGPRFTLTLGAGATAGLAAIGLLEGPPLWAPTTLAVAVCTVTTTLILQAIARNAEDNRRRFHELVNGIDAVVWEADASGKITFVSDNIDDVVGISAADYADSTRMRSRIHPVDQPVWLDARCLNAEGRSTEVHIRVSDDNDVYRRIQERVKVSLRQDGTIASRRGVLVDETRRWDAEAELRRYSDFIQGIPIALIIMRLDDADDPRSLVVTAMNPAAEGLFGERESERTPVGLGGVPKVQRDARVVDHVDVDPAWLARLAHVTQVGEPFESPFVRIPGSDGVFAVRAVPLPDQSVGVSLEDVTKRERLASSFRHQALHDSLTGLPNRAHLRNRLGEALAAAGEHAGESVALLLVDLDEFKEVNDALGHEYGDRLLTELARRLAKKLRHCDMVARLGGDEFAVLLTEGADVDSAHEVATRLLLLCERPFEIEDFRFQVSASVGIAVAPEHGTDADTLLRRADGAMYRAKSAGGGISVYSPGQDLYSVRRLELLGDLREAVQDFGDLVVHYQPRIDLRSFRTIGVEALVRWHHPRHGVLPPDEFIELAEVSGTIHRLTQQVSERASSEMSDLMDRHDISVSVNLSTKNLYDPTLLTWVSELMDRRGLGAGQLCFEITESQLMDDPSQSMNVLGGLQALGVRFSVDDFGTGYSSLSYLRQLPIDEVKIDRTFVADMQRDDAIVRSVIDLGHNLGLHVVAEGVEDTATLHRLRDLGCDSAQGFHLGRPMAADALAAYLEGAWESVVTLR